LRYATNKWKNAEYGMCYYQVGNQPYYFLNGKVKIKFTKIESGVDVYLNAGSDVRNMTEVVVKKNATVTVGTEYSIDQSVNFVITAIPK
jgi:prefoldin subunit 5